MFYYEPPCDDWVDRDKPRLISNTIEEICKNILEKGEHSRFSEIFDYMYLYVEDNIENFLPEQE